MIEISLAAEKITHIGPLSITNSLLATWIIIGVLVIFSLIVARNVKLIPKGITNFFELIIEFLLDTIENVTGDKKKALTLLPFLGTLFIFIIVNNWFGLFPGFGSITIFNGEHTVPLLRGGNADINSTLALALISVCVTHYIGMKQLGFFAHWKKYFNFFPNPIMGFVGLLELISEFSKMISFTFRLFGNIFAGEVLLLVIGAIAPLIAPLPFFGLEILVGLIQALVFMMLTLVFINIPTQPHGAEH